MLALFNNNNFFVEYGLSIIILNIISYLILLLILFSVIFLLNQKYFKTTNEFKNVGFSNYFLLLTVFTLLSLAGMPPLLGFIGKFLITIVIFINSSFFYFFIFVIINLFMIYFYLQNVRFLIKKTNTKLISLTTNFFSLDIKLINLVNLLNVMNLFLLLNFEDLLIFISS